MQKMALLIDPVFQIFWRTRPDVEVAIFDIVEDYYEFISLQLHDYEHEQNKGKIVVGRITLLTYR